MSSRWLLLLLVLLTVLAATTNGSKDTCETEPGKEEVSARRDAVVEATKHAWDSYVRYAWGYDELQPQSRSGVDTFSGMGMTVLDSLDTLYMMGLKSRFEQARDWVVNEFNVDKVGQVSIFETTIRALGGLLSAYELSGDEVFLRKAEELGYRLSSAFRGSTMPHPECTLSGMVCPTTWRGEQTFLAEVGTLQLEFHSLSRASSDPYLKKLGATTLDFVRRLAKEVSPEHNGVPPSRVHIADGTFSGELRTFGAPSDSYFEYLLKVWLQRGRSDRSLRAMFTDSIKGLLELAVHIPGVGTLVRDQLRGSYRNQMDHFACFLPGVLILGQDAADSAAQAAEWAALAANITDTCYLFYAKGTGGLAGDTMRAIVGSDGSAPGGVAVQVSKGYELRPETLEALFYMWRHTKDPKFRDMAWNIFESIETHCRSESGYSALHYNRGDLEPRDIMHSFFIAETLKYLFLIFSDDHVLDLRTHVLNTEAHPLLIDPS
mmetsp:Transcript_6421/g.19429  ORF Transcript_6421/g.19429 Transcript_6421/m.19429 type:complete len:490 (+) Transcript_6421:245-1714(+)